MRGRRPTGPECVDGLEGSPQARLRLKVVLQTIAGQCSVQDACLQLGVCEQRFHQLREQVLEAALQRMEPRRAGRKRRQATPESTQLQLVQQELAAAKIELRAAEVREEIALTLPSLRGEPAAEEKKTRQRTPRPRRRQRGKKRSM
jgi:hypothetical protein